jgi:hypothetical protein
MRAFILSMNFVLEWFSLINELRDIRLQKSLHQISGSWFRASAITTMNKNQPDAQ